jgi:hypothetical protein
MTKQILLSALILSTTSNMALSMNHKELELIKLKLNTKELELNTKELKLIIFELNKHKTVRNGFRKTKLDGNSLFDYLINDGYMKNPNPEFPHTKIIEFTKNQTYEDQTTLKALAKANRESKVFKNFKKHTKANNFTFCHDIDQRLNRDGKRKKVHGIIIGSPDKNHCDSYKKTQANRAANPNTI